MPLDPDWKQNVDAILERGSFEEVCEMLDDVVERLEAGQLSLNEGLDYYELGAKLGDRAEQLLADAELRISQLTIADDNEDNDAVSEVPF